MARAERVEQHWGEKKKDKTEDEKKGYSWQLTLLLERSKYTLSLSMSQIVKDRPLRVFVQHTHAKKNVLDICRRRFVHTFVAQRDWRCKGIHSKVKPISVSALMRPFDVINCGALIDLLPDAGNNNDMADSHLWRRGPALFWILYLHKNFFLATVRGKVSSGLCVCLEYYNEALHLLTKYLARMCF